MPWKNGRYIPREPTVNEQLANSVQGKASRTQIPRPLSTSQINSGFFSSKVISAVFASGSFTASVLKHLVLKSTFSPASGLRSLFSSGFVNGAMIEDGSVTGAKIVNPIKVSLISGGAAGNHTVSNIKINDELIAVLEQNGTSGILTDLSTEFSIVKADTIDNTGGTATSSDKLLIFYISK